MGSTFTLINYYAPNSQSDQLKILKEIQAKLKNIQIIDGTGYFWGGGGGVIGTVFLTNHWTLES